MPSRTAPFVVLAALCHLLLDARASGNDFDCASNGTQAQPSTCSMECLEICWSEFADAPCVANCWQGHGTTLLLAVLVPYAGRLLVDWVLGKAKVKVRQWASRLWRTRLCGDRLPHEKKWADLSPGDLEAALELRWVGEAQWGMRYEDPLFHRKWLQLTERQRTSADLLELPRELFGPPSTRCWPKLRGKCSSADGYDEAAQSSDEAGDVGRGDTQSVNALLPVGCRQGSGGAEEQELLLEPVEPEPELEPGLGFTMHNLTRWQGIDESKWVDAKALNGMTQCGALFRSVGRLVFWHAMQPLLYSAIFAMRSPELDALQFWLGAAVGVREAVYMLLTLCCTIVNPAFLIVDVVASVSGPRARAPAWEGVLPASLWEASALGPVIEASTWKRKAPDRTMNTPVDQSESKPWEQGLSFLLLYVLSPEKYVAFALFYKHKRVGTAVVGVGILLDLCGVAALGAGIGSGVLPPPLAVGYIVSALGGLGFTAVFMADWWASQQARWRRNKRELELRRLSIVELQKEAESLGLTLLARDNSSEPEPVLEPEPEPEPERVEPEHVEPEPEPGDDPIHSIRLTWKDRLRLQREIIDIERAQQQKAHSLESTLTQPALLEAAVLSGLGAVAIDIAIMFLSGGVSWAAETESLVNFSIVCAGLVVLVALITLTVRRWEKAQARTIVLVRAAEDGYTLQRMSTVLRADREVVLKAVSLYGYELEYASAKLQADREVVLTAVTQFGYALQHASEELRADREVVLAAVAASGGALEYASVQLRADREVVLVAVAKRGRALKHASAELQADEELRAMADRYRPS
jgi:hypothetical protein